MRSIVVVALFVAIFAANETFAQSAPKPAKCGGGAATEDISALRAAVESATAGVATIDNVGDASEGFHTSGLARDLAKLAGKTNFRNVVNFHNYKITNAGNFFSVNQVEFKTEADAKTAEKLLAKAGSNFRGPGLTQYNMLRKGNFLLLFVYSKRALTPENSALIDAIKKNYESM